MRALSETFSLIWLLMGLSLIITKLRSPTVSALYPKQAWDKIGVYFYLEKVATAFTECGKKDTAH